MVTKKKKKLRLKKKVFQLGIGMIFLILASFIGIHFYKEYQYKQTNEYKLIEKGYSLEEAKQIIDKTNEETIAKIVNQEKQEIIIKLIQEKYFLIKNFDEYLAYQKKEKEENLSDVIALVNTHANNKWYQVELETDITQNEKMLVNKFYALNEDYAPKDMKAISLDQSYGSEGENLLLSYAYDAFQDLWDAAYKEGHYLMVNSSYRNYKSQKSIYDSRKATQGERKADETAARPGHSEHQTGLVVDMTSKNEPSSTEFTNSKAYAWLKEHAYEYGFIERYPEGKTYITGYSPESWHWRYVGKEAAATIQKEQITYDEYYAYYIEQ